MSITLNNVSVRELEPGNAKEKDKDKDRADELTPREPR
ncbi:hypothetical protein FVEN_g12811 [Fusarium venenatum]|nr:hypothetical protein FVEN_g12811 [Fusarium venenatum]